MTTPHPHAEYLSAKIKGEDTSRWQTHRLGWLADNWEPADEWCGSILIFPKEHKLRRKPTPKVIDWSKLGRHVPVRFWEQEESHDKCLGFFYSIKYNSFISDCGRVYDHASLDTGLWVANHDGVNPWPEGCVIEIIWRDGRSPNPTNSCLTVDRAWDVRKEAGDIIMSRFHSLEPGYTFGDDQ